MGVKAASQQPDEWVRRESAAIQANQRKTNELLKEILDAVQMLDRAD